MKREAVWNRVSKQNPCRICERPDWCSYSIELNIAHCLRVESTRPSKNQMGGWLHPLDGVVFKKYEAPVKPRAEVKIDAEKMWKQWSLHTDNEKLKRFAKFLGVEPMALRSIGCVWAQEHQAWAFPQRDSTGKIIGIRLRNEDGYKWAVKGSKVGLYIPDFLIEKEVPTDY